jgi:hypothetical protein
MDRFYEILDLLAETAQKTHIDNKSKSDEITSDVQDYMDDEVETLDMVISALKNIVSNTTAIINNLDIDRVKENLTEPWVLGMIAVVEDNMSSVHDFVKFSGSHDDTAEAGKRPGLWENIRKKKQREGKKYKPAKTQKQGRPDPETWDKLTK